MIVGVDSVNRSRDYLPPINGEAKSNQQRWIKSKFPGFGETKAFSTFLVSELFPFIESNYSVLPNRTIIGYSNSGVFGLHTLVNSPKTFTNYLLISPAAWWGENELDEKIDAFSQTNPEYRGNLFLSVAGEGQGMYANALRVAAKLETSAPKSLNWSLKQFEQETHQSTIHPSIYQGLVELYKDVNFNVTESVGKYATIKDIEQYYNALSKRYDFTIKIPEIVFSDLADWQFTQQKQELAMNTLQAFVRAYPDSSFAYTSLAQGFMKTQQFAKAKVNFEKSLKIVKSSDIKDPSVADYLQDMVNAASSKL